MKANQPIYIIGAGGHTRSLINAVESVGLSLVGIYDDCFKDGETINGYPILGPLSKIGSDQILVLSTGDNQKREKLYNVYRENILKENIIHATAHIEKYVSRGQSNQILANVYINSQVELGENNLVNTGAIIEHEVKIGNHCHISVGSIICGRVTIGHRCMIGAGTVIIDNIKICNDVIVGAKTVVVGNILEPGVYVGSPARKIK